MKISVKTKKHTTPVVVEHSLPSSVAQAVEQFGEGAVLKAVCDRITNDVAGIVRRHIEKAPADIMKFVRAYKLSEKSRQPRKTPQEKAAALLSTLTPEQRKAVLASLGK